VKKGERNETDEMSKSEKKRKTNGYAIPSHPIPPNKGEK